MLAVRIIPCLDVRDGRVVKGVRFQGLRDAGSPPELAEMYELQGADELVFLDVSATPEGKATAVETVREVRERVAIPVTVGGGIREVNDARALLEAGADKVSVNTAAVKTPELVSQLADEFGTQCTVVAIDAKRAAGSGEGRPRWQVVVSGGKVDTNVDVLAWVDEVTRRGAGEILLTSWDRDGTRQGYDLELLRAVSERVNVPVIASGGAATPQHFIEALDAGASAVLAASIFHDRDMTVNDIKERLDAAGVEVRR